MNLFLLLLFCQAAAPETPHRDLRVAAFLGVECPLARLYAQRLNELKSEFPEVHFRAYAPNRQDTEAEIAEFQKLLEFPIEKGTAEAIRWGATHSPEVFLIEADQVVYSGRVDDQYLPANHPA